MFDQKKYISEENKIKAKELAEGLSHPLATNEDVLDIIHDKENYHHSVWLSLGLLSIRDGGVFLEAQNKIKEVMKQETLKINTEEKQMEIAGKKKNLIRKKIMEDYDNFQIINNYGEGIMVIGFPYMHKKDRVEKFAGTTLIHKSETPELFEKLTKTLFVYEG